MFGGVPWKNENMAIYSWNSLFALLFAHSAPFLLTHLGLYVDQTNSAHEQISLCVSQAGI